MIVRLPRGQKLAIPGPERSYAPFERVDGTVVDLDDFLRRLPDAQAEFTDRIKGRRQRGFTRPDSPTHARHTHCIHGHPLEGDNVVLYSDGGRVRRSCRTCRRDRKRASRARAAAAKPKPIQRDRTRCRNGHELTPENLIGQSRRRCRACAHSNHEAWKLRRAA